MEPLPPLDSGYPPKYVAERTPGGEVVARVRWIRPGTTEDFALTKILIEVPCLSYLDARTVGSTVYQSFREDDVARELYADAQEFELAMHRRSRFRARRKSCEDFWLCAIKKEQIFLYCTNNSKVQ